MSIMSPVGKNGKHLPSPLVTKEVRAKIQNLEAACHKVLVGEASEETLVVPPLPGRDVEVRALKDLPKKPGLASNEGQARLLHDLASIELQAMELAFRSLCEFPLAPKLFKEQLAQVALDEARHLKLCLDTIEDLGHGWGEWPVHLSLWNCVDRGDDLLDRLLIVHRFLEGSGLDAGDTLLIKLSGVPHKGVRHVVRCIHDEELAHVKFGSEWFNEICRLESLVAEDHFCVRLKVLKQRLPRRLEPVKAELRLRAGFSNKEIDSLNGLRDLWLKEKSKDLV